eukprot:gene18291-18714_t
MAEEAPEIVVVIETHLNATYTDEEVACDPATGYQLLARLDRDAPAPVPNPPTQTKVQPQAGQRKARKKPVRKNPEHGGGIMVFVKGNRQCRDVHTHRGKDFELVAFDDVESGHRITAVYRRPGHAVSGELLEALDEQIERGPQALVLGDLNMNMLAKRPQPHQLHTMLARKHGLNQHVATVTRPAESGSKGKHRKPQRGTVIDHVWAKQACACSCVASLTSLSDHRAIRIRMPAVARTPAKKAKVVWRRRWDRMDLGKAAAILTEEMPVSETLSGILRPHYPRDAAEEMRRRGVGLPTPPDTGGRRHAGAVLDGWEKAWSRIKHELVPKVRTRERAEPPKYPWVTEAVKTAMAERNRLRRAAAAAGATAQAKEAYREARRKAEFKYKSARRQFIRTHLEKAGQVGFSREHWQFINRLMGRKVKRRAEPDCSPDAVNQAFIDKVRNIRKPLENEPPPHIHNTEEVEAFTRFTPATPGEVEWELSRMNAT